MKTWANIIIHHSETKDGLVVDWNAIRDYHIYVKGWDDIGYHFGVEDIWGKLTLQIGRSLDMDGAHTLNQNHNSIGIVLIGNYNIAKPTPDQYDMIGNLCKVLMRVYNIPVANIYGHRSFSQKTCPGKNFDLQYLSSLL